MMLTTRKREYLKYLLAGIASYLVDLLSFLFLNSVIQAPLVVSITVSFVLGLTCSFLVNKIFVFGAVKGSSVHRAHRQAVMFGVLVFFNYLFTYASVHYMLGIKIDPALAKTIATGCITLWNYILFNKVIFKTKS